MEENELSNTSICGYSEKDQTNENETKSQIQETQLFENKTIQREKN